MSDEIEDALRRELRAELVPFDEARAEDMIRLAAEAGLAGTPRAWVAPLAAAAAVVVIGGGVALATARGGGGNSAGGPEQPGGPGVSASNNADMNAGPCAPIGTDDPGGVYSASEAPSRSVLGSVQPIYSAVDEASSAPATPPYPTVSPTSEPSATVSDVPVGKASDLPEGTAAEVPAGSATGAPEGGVSSGPVDLTPSGGAVICLVGPATPVPLGSASCTKGHHSVTCVSTGVCTTPEDNPPAPPTSSDGPYSAVLCVEEASGSYAPLPSAESSDQPGTVGTCGANEECAPTTPPSSSADDFTIDTTVAPGQSRTFDGPHFSAGQAFVATAFILQNPAADEGRLTVEGDAGNRLSEALSDFRDVDFHFDDKAITYDADHPLRITVDCANTSTACTPAVLVSGYWTQH